MSFLSYSLPSNLIAKYPVHPRDHSRLMLLNRKDETLQSSFFYNICNYLCKDDLLIINNTHVEARRVLLEKISSHATFECLFVQLNSLGYWEILVARHKKLKPNDILVSINNRDIEFTVRINPTQSPFIYLETQSVLDANIFQKIGTLPIPPYLKRKYEKTDQYDYQSIFACNTGSIASPTSTLHFTHTLIKALQEKGVSTKYITLEIGYGTFAPLSQYNYKTRTLHTEKYCIPEDTAYAIRNKHYNRLIVVGTTALRTIETVYRKTNGTFDNYLKGTTNLFLLPPDTIHTADGLITNFHFPSSSLLLLVQCMVKESLLRRAYEQAIKEAYRFYSYGDAMFIL